MDPIATDDEYINSLKTKIEKVILSIDKRLKIHDFRIVIADSFTNIIFDLEVPYKFGIKNENLVNLVSKKISELNSSYRSVINIDNINF